MHLVRVVSSEISGGKFPEMYSNLSGNFRKFVEEFFSRYTFDYNHVNQLFPSPALKSDAVK